MGATPRMGKGRGKMELRIGFDKKRWRNNKKKTLDEQYGCVVGLAGRVLGRARVISGVAGGDRVDGQQRHAAVQAHRRDAHLRGQFLAVERPTERDGQVAVGGRAMNGHRLARSDGLVVVVREFERHDSRWNWNRNSYPPPPIGSVGLVGRGFPRIG